MYQRSVTEFDRQRRKLEREYSELLVKVSRLTDEASTLLLPSCTSLIYAPHVGCARETPRDPTTMLAPRCVGVHDPHPWLTGGARVCPPRARSQSTNGYA